MPEYERRSTQAVAINPDNLASHTKWAEANGFDFPLCVDTDKQVATAYGARTLLGGIQRSVFLVDKRGKIAWAREGASTTDEILAAIDALNS